jgi:hypothetical protein
MTQIYLRHWQKSVIFHLMYSFTVFVTLFLASLSLSGLLLLRLARI